MLFGKASAGRQDSMGDKLKVAFVVQRCGLEVNGGSEAHCLMVARHMQEWWDVEIVTTCAVDYVTWKDYYKEGRGSVHGVPVIRFGVDHPRDPRSFGRYTAWLQFDRKMVTRKEAEHWMKLQGPVSSGLLGYLGTSFSRYDRFLFFTYLYATTYLGLPLVAGKAYLVPTAHDEWPIYLPIYDSWFSRPQGYLFNTNEEMEFLKSRFPFVTFRGAVCGVGIDARDGADGDRFRKQMSVDAPYIIYVGRIDEQKGCSELFDFFLRYKRQTKSDLKLVLLGNRIMNVPRHEDIIEAGFVDEDTKFDAIEGSLFLVNPSTKESLSLVLLEAWSLGKPTLVSGRCEVAVGQSRRSNAGLWYSGYEEFVACTEYLLGHGEIGSQGREFVTRTCSWPRVAETYRAVVERGDDLLGGGGLRAREAEQRATDDIRTAQVPAC